MAQSFSPPEQTEETFHYLKRRASTALLQELMNVWRKLIRNPVFPVSNWSVFMFSVRTSIDLEGWHNRLNARFCRAGRVSLYMLLIELYKEATGVPLVARLLSSSCTRKQQVSLWLLGFCHRAVQGSNRYTVGCTTIFWGEEGKNQQEEDQLYLLNGKLFQMWSDYRDGQISTSQFVMDSLRSVTVGCSVTEHVQYVNHVGM